MADGGDKVYKLRITADASPLGQETKKAAANMNELTKGAQQLASSLTGGLIGGGIVSSIEFGVRHITKLIQDARQLLRDAENLNISKESVQYARNLGVLAGYDEKDPVVINAMQNADQARSEALAGSAPYVKAFRDLGLDLGKMASMENDQLIQEILESIPKDVSRDQRIALRTLIGEREGAGLEQLAAGGFFKNRRVREIAGDTGKVKFDETFTPGDLAALRARNKVDMQPLANFGRGDENKAAILEENNDQRARQIARERLSTEQQLLEITRDRLALLRKIEEEQNPIRRAQLRNQVNDLDSQRNAILGALGAGQNGPGRYEVDQYTRVGLRAFGSGDATLNIGREQLKAIRELKTELKRLPADTAEALRTAI